MGEHLQAFQHISKHLTIFGFTVDNKHASILQCCKELLDNAYEATRGTVLPEIAVRLTALSATTLELSVNDNGSGISDLNFVEALNCFSSNRGAAAEAVIGRFGCGLSASAMYSLSTTKEPVRVVSKTGSAACVKIADVTFDADSGKAVLLQHQEVACDNMECGTKIQLRLLRDANLGALTLSIKELLCRFAILADPRTTIGLFVRDETNTLCDITLGMKPNEPSSHYKVHSIYGIATSLVYGLVKDRRFDISDAFFAEASAAAAGLRVTAKASLVLHTTGEPALVCYLDLLRYVNRTPLLDYLDEGISCTVSRALRRVAWAKFGCQLRQCITSDSTSSMLNNPKWELLVWSRESGQVSRRIVERILLVVDISGQTGIPFSSLKKMAIGESTQIYSGCLQAIDAAMCDLQEAHPDIFIDKQAAKKNKFSKLAPYVANSIAKMITFSHCPDFQTESLRQLGLPTSSLNESAMAATILEKISEIGRTHFDEPGDDGAEEEALP